LDAGAKGAYSKAVSVQEMAGAIKRLLEGGHSEA
jgi:DNA-binding NarL/FixJ family response regulator